MAVHVFVGGNELAHHLLDVVANGWEVEAEGHLWCSRLAAQVEDAVGPYGFVGEVEAEVGQ